MPPPYLLIETTPSNPYFRSIRPSNTSPVTPTPIPPHTFSPQSTDLLNPNTNRTCRLNPPPLTPGPWTWTCHHCHRTYRLSVTSRCLNDGHTFCSGTTVMRKWRTTSSSTSGETGREQMVKKIRHEPCTSEFDYAGWSRWGLWRRGVGERMRCERGRTDSGEGRRNGVGAGSGGKSKKDCWNKCDYPSECRWGRRYGMCTLLEEEDDEDVPVFYVDATPTCSSDEREYSSMVEKPGESGESSSSPSKKEYSASALDTIIEEEDDGKEEMEISPSTVSSGSSLSPSLPNALASPSPFSATDPLKPLLNQDPTSSKTAKSPTTTTPRTVSQRTRKRRKSRTINNLSNNYEENEQTLSSFPPLTRIASRP